MKNIKILGTGCPKCKQTEAIVRQALAEMGMEAQVEKVEDMMQIMSYNILSTPAVVVDEVVQLKGRVPSLGEVKEILSVGA
jgi:small redox-active disulfide protein 2